MQRNLADKKGAATTELVFIFPLILVFLCGFVKLFRLATEARLHLITADYAAFKDLRQRESIGPVFDRPCKVDPQICTGRKNEN